MSTISVILFSVAGFMVGLVGWLAFGMAPLVALAIWVGSGPAAILVAAIRATVAAHTRAEVIRMIEAQNSV